MDRAIESFIAEKTVEHCGSEYQDLKLRRSGVGCINETWEIYGDNLASLFLKLGRATAHDMYLREMEGLSLLSQAQKIKIPKAYAVESNGDCALLIMEFIPLQPLRVASEVALGEGLAELHSLTSETFGLANDNYIGRSLQPNELCDDWWDFYCNQRLGVQLAMAADNGMRGELQERLKTLIEHIPQFFKFHQPKASLLHGDLWNGNVAADLSGTPVIFDPAVYYGDAETDIAMSQMFQPLGNAVYDVYYKHFPSQPGHDLRRHLYDLYHWLNHFNLFGVTYLGQVERSLDALLLKML